MSERPNLSDKADFMQTFTTLRQMFLLISTDEVFTLIWNHYPSGYWAYSKSGGQYSAINKVAFNLPLIIKFIAVYIRLMEI